MVVGLQRFRSWLEVDLGDRVLGGINTVEVRKYRNSGAMYLSC